MPNLSGCLRLRVGRDFISGLEGEDGTLSTIGVFMLSIGGSSGATLVGSD